MQLISATKLHNLKRLINESLGFKEAAYNTLTKCLKIYKYKDLAPKGSIEQFLLNYPQNTHNKKTLAIVIASDQGLCGGFNNQILKNSSMDIKNSAAEGRQVDIIAIGRKAYEFFTNQAYVNDVQQHAINIKQLELESWALANKIEEKIITGGYGEVIIYANHFKNMILQTYEKTMLLQHIMAPNQIAPDTTLDVNGLLESSFKIYIGGLLHYNILLSKAGEESARVISMDNASRNAKSLIDNLTLTMNRARQAIVTTELIEITTSAEVL
jgi:F-type H+-transporting ATPase subunit gamma